MPVWAAFVRRLRQTQCRVEQMIAKRVCCLRVTLPLVHPIMYPVCRLPQGGGIVLSDIGYDLGKIVYCRVGDFDSEIHFGMSARTSSIDLLSSG